VGYYLMYDEESGKSLYVEAQGLMEAIERSVCIDYDQHSDGDYISLEGC
jgi:hypothetical protein